MSLIATDPPKPTRPNPIPHPLSISYGRRYAWIESYISRTLPGITQWAVENCEKEWNATHPVSTGFPEAAGDAQTACAVGTEVSACTAHNASARTHKRTHHACMHGH